MGRTKRTGKAKGSGTGGGGSGTVTNVIGDVANGFTVTVTNPTTTPDIAVSISTPATVNTALGVQTLASQQAAGTAFVQSKVTVTQAQRRAGTAIDIPEYPATAGGYWRIGFGDEFFTGVTIGFVNTLGIRANGTSKSQLEQGNLAGTANGNDQMVSSAILSNNGIYNPNAKMQVVFDAPDATGTGTCVLYLSGQFITS
jgi:hypothetical protein